MFAEEAKRLGVPQRKPSKQEIQERCLYAMINEGAQASSRKASPPRLRHRHRLRLRLRLPALPRRPDVLRRHNGVGLSGWSLLSSTVVLVLLCLSTQSWGLPQGAVGWGSFLGVSLLTTVAIVALYASTARIGPFRTALGHEPGTGDLDPAQRPGARRVHRRGCNCSARLS
jgi:hypothetical protein